TQPNRRGTDPYARWCGRREVVRLPPIPIQMLFRFEIDDHRGPPWSETPPAVQPRRQLTPRDPGTVRTDHLGLVGLNHSRREGGHFGQLAAQDGPGLNPTEVRLTVPTGLYPGFQNPVRLCSPRPRLARMPKRRSVLLPLALSGQVALHVSG